MSKDFTTEERSIKISFNDETHNIELNKVTGKEMILAVESLKNKVTEASGMPYELAVATALAIEGGE